MTFLVVVPPGLAGDILRGGVSNASGRKGSQARATAGAEAAEAAKATAQDRLARTTQAITAVRNMQKGVGPALSVPDGLTPGGLQKATGINARWDGAQNPVQNGANVTIKQTSSQAVLHWETFNVGRNTSLYFDQTAGKTDAGKWIAFNKVFDPTGVPSKILGSIKAEGQVYILNQNGIIFGAGSQVNTRTLVASSLPVNDNLLTTGLLNNRDAQFLLSSLEVPGGSDGTAKFTPPPILTANGQVGDVVVQYGAELRSKVNDDGNGGRIMLAGANVTNEGYISTPGGQTILAAGLQVGVQAHDGGDPSLRGLDVWIGKVGSYAGAATNRGLIEAYNGSVLVAGREVNQLGVIDSTTSVNLNGRIDLLASYDAVGNPNYDRVAGANLPPFLSQHTGVVNIGEGSVMRVMPDLLSTKTIPGTKLPESSRVNIEGLAVRFGADSILLAPSGNVTVRAGIWPYKDADNNGTTLDAAGNDEDSLALNLVEGRQRFQLAGGQVYVDRGALIDVSGSPDVFVALAQHLLTVQLRGSELADSPLQRAASLRGISLLVDLNRTGTYYGREWIGTPLGDLTGLAGIVERNVAQLTARGGTVSIEAGDSIVLQNASTIDVSGGYLRHEGGWVETSRLLRGRHLINIEDATPDMLYDGVYEGTHTEISTKWGITKTYHHALAPMGGFNQQEYIEGAAGGTISLQAPSLVLGGDLRGRTIKGPRQLDNPPAGGTLELAFLGEKSIVRSPTDIRFIQHSPSAPNLSFVPGNPVVVVPEFTLVGGEPAPLSVAPGGQFLLGTALFDEEQGGFSNLTIDNRDGDLLIPRGTPLKIPAGGSLSARARNVFVEDNIVAPGGSVAFTAYNFSPFLYQELKETDALDGKPAPAPQPGRGLVAVARDVTISTAGMLVDDRPTSPLVFDRERVLEGGAITLEGYSVRLGEGSFLDASGGVQAKPNGDFAYGTGGDIALLAGKDPDLDTTTGGELVMKGRVQAYSVTEGGSLTLQANLIQVGGAAAPDGGLLVGPEFFRQGGFSHYALVGIGARDGNGGYLPALRVTAGTVIEPVTESWVVAPYGQGRGTLAMRPFFKPVGYRAPASVSLTGLGADDDFVPPGGPDLVEALGLVVLEEGSRISTDPGGAVSLKGDAVAVLGSINVPGGDIDIEGAASFRLPVSLASAASFALPTVYIGPQARLSAAGAVVLLPDPFGRRSGILYAGGTIRVAGNIVAESGAVLDVSGASAVLDFHPTRLGSTQLPLVPASAGLNAAPWGQRFVPVRVDSDGGLISLEGAQMLYSDATLLGRAGGPTALGGSLAISSGRFYSTGEVRTSADINLIVQQTGNALKFGDAAKFGSVGDLMAGRTDLAAAFLAGTTNRGIGYFAVDQFTQGGFDSLDLGYNFDSNPNFPLGGNVEFRGAVDIAARGFVRVAGGGVIRADAPVQITAPYVAVGREFVAPLHPDDNSVLFREFDGTLIKDYFPAPEFGPGELVINARLVDLGTLLLKGVGRATFAADGGDIRGNGTVSMAGDLILRAAQVYPTTLAEFNVFAYDHAGVPGSVTIIGSGRAAAPLSAGGSMGIFASIINQGGVLHAPFGSITLGWDGVDLDPSDADLDQPRNRITGSSLAVPTASVVTLQPGSVTSISGLDPATGAELLVPYGLSPDGLSWIDPRGVNVTTSGLPVGKISISGNSVVTAPGSVIDLRGGGDLLAYRWIPGTGGSIDLLGSPTKEWASATSYDAGDIVTYRGKTWSARVAIDPGEFAISPVPSQGRYWTYVPDSYAIVPRFASNFAPFNSFNTGVNANALGGDPGFVPGGLPLGQQIYLEATAGLPAGYYTLLPRRYALLPGAFLVIPQESAPIGTAVREEGSSYASGYTFNFFDTPQTQQTLRSRFEVVPPAVLAARAEYDLYSANTFMKAAAARLDIEDIQHLPIDAGSLAFHGNTALRLEGAVQAGRRAGGRGADIDVSSFADIYLVGQDSAPPPGATAILRTDILNSWGAESLLVGGLRRSIADGVQVDVRAKNLMLDNAGGEFSAPEITLVAKEKLTLADGAAISSSGGLSRPAETLLLLGDGALLRVSADVNASISRSAVTGAMAPLMTIGAGVRIAGAGVILDSTYGSDIDPGIGLIAEALTLGSGQISIVFDHASGVLAGSVVDPHLVLAGALLSEAQKARILTLQSYRTIDIYGSGVFGGPDLEQLNLLGGGLRGYEQAAGSVVFQARDVRFDNSANINVGALPVPSPVGELRFESNIIRLGSNAFSISGYQNLLLNAAAGVLAEKTGSFHTAGNLTVNAPLIAGAGGIKQTFTAAGAMNLLATSGTPLVKSGLGATLEFLGASVVADANIYLPSGSLELHATSGNLTVGGKLSVEGSAQEFYDLTRYADAGQMLLASDTGDVTLLAGSHISVAADEGGGNAGLLVVQTPQGTLNALGAIEGAGGEGGRDGSFELDAGSIASFSDLAGLLDDSKLFESRSFRIRNGDVVVGGYTKAHNFLLATDSGSILVNGTIDASGVTGGKIELSARNNLTIATGALLTAAAEQFSNAGEGGEISLEAGAQKNGNVNLSGFVDLQAGATIDLSVAEYVAGSYTTPGSSAFYGAFQGVLHLRAPRNAANSDLGISALNSTIKGASSIIAEGYTLHDLTASGGLMTGWRSTQTALPTAGTLQRTIYDSANAFLSAANLANMTTRLLGADSQGLGGLLVVAPGVEIINRTGNLTLGLTNATSLGSASLNSADWNLSDFRFGAKHAPGILTLRAAGDVVFNNALSDGFNPVVASAANGNSSLWLGQLKDVDPLLPVNTQSWSYRITAGADMSSANIASVVKGASGSVLVGQFYTVPGAVTSGASPNAGVQGLTANQIKISTTAADLGTRFEVVRTGAGSIDINAAKDVQLRNQFATIYTAGVRIPQPQTIYNANDFRPPTFYFSGQPTESGLGVPQQYYGALYVDEAGQNRRMPQWSLAGGGIAIRAGNNVGRYTQVTVNGQLTVVADSSRQLPGNWLYRRGTVDPNTGLPGSATFNPDGVPPVELFDPLASTTWWIDFSNFFQGVGALGGGDVSVVAGGDIVNLDVVIPTNARMPGRDAGGNPIAPSDALLLELGGGDLTVRAGNNIDGGVYYVERGNGILNAGGQITTNAARELSFGILGVPGGGTPPQYSELVRLPTTLFLGKGGFDVTARGDILLGPVANPFLLPAGLNNKSWYRTYFNTYAEDSEVNVSSFGGSVTHRLAVTMPGTREAQPILLAWLKSQNVFSSGSPTAAAAYYQPWLRLSESTLDAFGTVTSIMPPTLRSTAFAGDINIVGAMNLFPSPTGTVELAASGGIIGLQPTGIGSNQAGAKGVAWSSARINLSDADPASINGITTPSGILPVGNFLGRIFNETGSFTGIAAGADVKRALHSPGLLHADDTSPLRLYAAGGDITGLTLYSPKLSNIYAERDITDIAFYIQHVIADSISVVSAGRDIVPYNENAPLRALAGDITRGNIIIDPPEATVLVNGELAVTTTALPGDIQVSGPGTLEVLAARNVDLGTGANLTDGRGVGITSIGNARNPFLSFAGADLVVFAGVGGEDGGPALGLARSTLNFKALLEESEDGETEELRALAALDRFFAILRQTAADFQETGSYDAGFAAANALFGEASQRGEIFTRARDIRTVSGGSVTMAAPSGGLTMASDIFGNPLTPPGVVTEYGGPVSIFTHGSVDIGQARIFTLRGGDLTIWSSAGDIAAGNAPRTVVTAPPTRVLIDSSSADVQTDLGGLATGGGIGVLASVENVEPGDVVLIAPEGTVDAGDAGIRATGNVTIAAVTVLNADNISAGGSTVGVPATPAVAAPNIAGLSSAAGTTGAAANSATQISEQARPQDREEEEPPSIIMVEVLGYGGEE